jgi:hypothetical protein
MKTRAILNPSALIYIAVIVILTGCGSARQAAVSCPELPGYNGGKTHVKHLQHKTGRQSYYVSKSTASKRHRYHASGSKADIGSYISPDKNMRSDITGNAAIPENENLSAGMAAALDNSIIYSEERHDRKADLMQGRPIDDRIAYLPDGCDTIVMKSGSRLYGKVEELGQYEIKYRRCDNLTGPVIAVSKSQVAGIYYSNGTHDAIPSDTPVTPVTYTPLPPVDPTARIDGLAIAGFSAGLIGLFIAGVPLGILSVVFSAISMGRIKKSRGMIRGRGLAVAGLILGFIDIIGAIYAMSVLL